MMIQKGLNFPKISFIKKHYNSLCNIKDLKLSSIWLVLVFYAFCLIPSTLLAAEIECGTCHSKAAESHQLTTHGKIDVDCKSCHGDGEKHVSAPSSNNIFSFSSQLNKELQEYKVCNNCHNNNHSTELNAHSAAGISCGSCHNIHPSDPESNKLSNLPFDIKRLSPGSSLCYQCHQDTFTQFQFNERHRLTEGVVECTSCHDPHNPQVGMELGGFKQSVCSDCHANVEGPFVFEHAASRVEGCAACHQPHGSPNRHMLKIQEVGALCYTCHADAPQFHIGFSPTAPPRFDESTVCTNCHAMIHGSNLDSKLLR